MADTTDNYEKYIRQSETVEQQDYETRMLSGHHPESCHSTNDESGNMNEESHSSVKSKGKGIWNNKVKPAFPEAVADIHIVKNTFKVESSVKQDMHDVVRFPEITRVAEVRRGLGLCLEERRFLEMRKVVVRNGFAKYLGIDPAEVHPDDVPVVGLAGSGGGFCAMIGNLGYVQAMKQSDLWDLLTYAAGVSGACWSLAAYYTFGQGSIDRVIDNCKETFHPHHPISAEAIRKILTAPDGAYVTLGPIAPKHHSVCILWQWICIRFSQLAGYFFGMTRQLTSMLPDMMEIGTNGQVLESSLKAVDCEVLGVL